MLKYFVRLYARTPISFTKDRETQQTEGSASPFTIPDFNGEGQVYDLLTKEIKSGLNLHCGLAMDEIIEAENIEKAMENAKAVAEGIFNLCFFITLTECQPAKVVFAYEYDSGISNRKFIQETHVKDNIYTPVVGNLKVINQGQMIEVFQRYTANVSKESQERIGRALSYLRKSNNDSNLLDKFIYLWIGLESIQDDLNILFPDPNPPVEGKSWYGIKSIFNELGFNCFNKSRGHRGALIHGGNRLINTSKTRDYIEKTRKVLITALAKLIKLEPDLEKQLRDTEPSRMLSDQTLRIETTLNNSYNPPLLKEIYEQPFIKFQGLERFYNLETNGKLGITFKNTSVVNLANNANFGKNFYIEILGNEDANVESSGIKFEKSST